MTDDNKQNQSANSSQKMYIDLSGRGGLGPRWYGDEGDTLSQYPQYRYIGDSDQKTATIGMSTATELAAGVYNPTRRYGYMAPAPNSFTTVAGSFNADQPSFANEWSATVFDSAGHAWFGENGNFIWRETTGGTYTPIREPFVFGGALPGTNVRITDFEIYQINGVRNIFYSYQETAAGGNIGNIVSPDSGGSQTWLQSTCAGGFYLGKTNAHFMVVADNGFMYIGDGNAMHKIDGTAATGGANGTATQNVLVDVSGYSFVDAIDYKGALWIAREENPPVASAIIASASFSGNKCGVYVWDRLQTVVNMTDYIPLVGVKAIRKIYVTQNGELRVLVLTSKDTVQIRQYDGNIFAIVDEALFTAWPTYRDSFTVAGNLVYWLGQDARLYAHGPIVIGESDSLYCIGDTSSVITGSYDTGSILFVDDLNSKTKTRTALMFSIISQGSPAVTNRIWYPNGVGATPLIGNVYTMVKYFPGLVKVNYARVYHNVGTVSNAATVQGTLNIYLNQATSNPATYSITQLDVGKGFKYCPINQGARNAVFGIQAQIQWATGTTTADATDWLPRILEIDYTSIEKLM